MKKNIVVGLVVFIILAVGGMFLFINDIHDIQPNERLVLPDPPEIKQEVAVVWQSGIKIASGDGFKGPWRMNQSVWDYIDDPTVVINDEGLIAVAWVDQDQMDIFLQIYESDGKKRFEKPVNVSQSPNIFSWLPRMVTFGQEINNVYILWQEIVFSGGSHGGEIFFARSIDGGRTFTRSLNLSNSIAGDGKGRLTLRYWHNGSLDLALSPQGNLYAAWTEFEGKLWFSRSIDGGDSFSKPMVITGEVGAKPARGPSLAIGTDGVIYLVWAVGEDPMADIHFAKSEDGGQTFSQPKVVFESDGHADAPKIVVDKDGGLHLVFAESPFGPFRQYYIYYTRSNNGGLTFEKPRRISGLREGFESHHFPCLALDGVGNIYIIWEHFPDFRGRSFGLGFIYSDNGGKTFSSPSIIPGSANSEIGFTGNLQGLLTRKLSVNAKGIIAVVNSFFERNETSQIWLFQGQINE